MTMTDNQLFNWWWEDKERPGRIIAIQSADMTSGLYPRIRLTAVVQSDPRDETRVGTVTRMNESHLTEKYRKHNRGDL